MAKIYRFPSAQAAAERGSGADVASASSQPGLPVKRRWRWNRQRLVDNLISTAIVVGMTAWLIWMVLPWIAG